MKGAMLSAAAAAALVLASPAGDDVPASAHFSRHHS